MKQGRKKKGKRESQREEEGEARLNSIGGPHYYSIRATKVKNVGMFTNKEVSMKERRGEK